MDAFDVATQESSTAAAVMIETTSTMIETASAMIETFNETLMNTVQSIIETTQPSSGEFVGCSEAASRCNSSLDSYCLHGGVCCVTSNDGYLCSCPSKYEGNRCQKLRSLSLETKDDVDFSSYLTTTGLCIFFVVVTLLTLIGFVLVILQRRRRKLLNQDADLNMDIVLVQEGASRTTQEQGTGEGDCQRSLNVHIGHGVSTSSFELFPVKLERMSNASTTSITCNTRPSSSFVDVDLGAV